MRTKTWAVAAATMAVALSATVADSQEGSRTRPPAVRVYSRDGALATNYLQPAVEVYEDAYVFAVMMDLDGRIQVLHPDMPGISVRLTPRRELQLPNFFVGYAQSAGGQYSAFGYSGYGDGADVSDARGTVIALASREPFKLELVESGGDWDISTIRRLIERRSPDLAARSLARYLGANGEPIGHDYMRFAGRRSSSYAYSSYAMTPCDLYYGYSSYYGGTSTLAQLNAINRVLYLQSLGQPVRILGYDYCGMPIVSYGPNVRFPGGRGHHPGDTTVFPKSRFPVVGTFPRLPGNRGSEFLNADGIPRSGPAGQTQTGGARSFPPRSAPGTDPTPIATPPRTGGRAESPMFEPRSESGARGLPASEPISRSGNSRAEPATVASPVVPIYRSEPRVVAPSHGSFPRERVESAPVAAPPRIIHESPPPQREAPPPRYDPPPPPPPRSEPATSAPPPRTEPTKPPPRR